MAITTRTTTWLYDEVRGSGPAVLLISGATGDAGHFTSVATVVLSGRRAPFFETPRVFAESSDRSFAVSRADTQEAMSWTSWR